MLRLQTTFEHLSQPFDVWKERAVTGGTLDRPPKHANLVVSVAVCRVSSGHMNFITGAGGLLQSAVHGWAQARVHVSRASSLSLLHCILLRAPACVRGV